MGAEYCFGILTPKIDLSPIGREWENTALLHPGPVAQLATIGLYSFLACVTNMN